MKLTASFSTKKRTVSLVPLVDVVFILLLFFMLSSTFIQKRQLPLNVAAHANVELSSPVMELQLLSNEGNVLVDGQEIERLELSAYFDRVDLDATTIIAIGIEPTVKVQALVTLLDVLKEADRRRIALVR